MHTHSEPAAGNDVVSPETSGTQAAVPPSPTARWLRLLLQEDINFLLTNRIPRRLCTRLMGWFSRIESQWLTWLSIAIWRRFSPDLDLRESVDSRFRTLRECFIRELRPGARPVDPDPAVVTSPCDAVVGACGSVRGTEVLQCKGMSYDLRDLLGDDRLVDRHQDGLFVTLRLRSSMYHRFHAPDDCRVRRVNYLSGDTFNVNPIALKRVERLFCRNERAVVELEMDDPDAAITLVPVAAILVASIRLHCLPGPLLLRERGSNHFACDVRYRRGDEMGWFEHGSTIVLFASGGFELCADLRTGDTIRMGRPLLRRVAPASVGGGDPTSR